MIKLCHLLRHFMKTHCLCSNEALLCSFKIFNKLLYPPKFQQYSKEIIIFLFYIFQNMSKKTVFGTSHTTTPKNLQKQTIPEILEKICQLHQKNKEKENKAQIANKKIVQNHINTKQYYQDVKLKQRESKIENVFAENIKKTQTMEKKHGEKMKKILQRLKDNQQKQNRKRKVLEQKSEEKLKRVDEKKKDKTISNFQNIQNKTSINYWNILTKKESENSKFSENMLNKTMIKLKNAEENRTRELKKYKQKSQEQFRQKIKRNAWILERMREKQNLTKSVEKIQNFKERLQKIIHEEEKSESKKKQSKKKHFEKVRDRKKQNEEKQVEKNEKLNNVLEQKISSCSDKKKERISAFLTKLHFDKVKIEEQVNLKYTLIKQKERQKAYNLYSKDIKQWNFFTSVQEEKKKLIEANIYDSNQLSLLK